MSFYFYLSNEYILSTNKFDQPVVLKDGQAIATILIRLLLLNPGTIQSHPDMGIGLISRYRYMDTTEINSLKLDMEDQINTYLPQFTLTEVELSIVDNDELNVRITIDNTIYSLVTDKDTLRLSDL